MKTHDNQDYVLYRLYLIFSIVGAVSGTGLLLFNILSASPILFIILSIVYFTTVIIFILIFTMRWNSIFHPKFLEAVKQSGITGIYLNKNWPFEKINKELSEKLKSNNLKNIKILAYYGFSLLESIKDDLLAVIAAGVRVKIIVSESGSAFIDDVLDLECDVAKIKDKAAIENKKAESIRDQEKALRILKELENISNTSGKRFEYKKYNTHARYALIAINDEWAWWTPYQPGIKVMDTTSFVLENCNKPAILWQCIEHFKALWSVLPEEKPNVSHL